MQTGGKGQSFLLCKCFINLTASVIMFLFSSLSLLLFISHHNGAFIPKHNLHFFFSMAYPDNLQGIPCSLLH